MTASRRRSEFWRTAEKTRDLVLGVISAAFAMDAPCFALDNEMTVTARMSEETVINGYAYADKNCALIEMPELFLTESPHHGIVCSRIEDFKVAGDSGLDRACVGRHVRGINIFYFARSGYRGPDSLRYEEVVDQGRKRVPVRVSVMVAGRDGSNAAAGADDPLSGPTMPVGPIPTCVGPVS